MDKINENETEDDYRVKKKFTIELGLSQLMDLYGTYGFLVGVSLFDNRVKDYADTMFDILFQIVNEIGYEWKR